MKTTLKLLNSRGYSNCRQYMVLWSSGRAASIAREIPGHPGKRWEFVTGSERDTLAKTIERRDFLDWKAHARALY